MDNVLGLPFAASMGTEREAEPVDDYCLLAQFLVPTEAHLMCGCLLAAGVPAVLADTNHMQADLLLAPAMGGARILVPESWLARGHAALAAFARGEFALQDDVDVGSAEA